MSDTEKIKEESQKNEPALRRAGLVIIAAISAVVLIASFALWKTEFDLTFFKKKEKVQEQISEEERIIESLTAPAAPPDAAPRYTEEEEEQILESLTAPPPAPAPGPSISGPSDSSLSAPTISEEEKKAILDSLSAPASE